MRVSGTFSHGISSDMRQSISLYYTNQNKMKKIILVVIVLGVIAGYYALNNERLEYVQSETIEKIVEKEVPTLEKRIADAINASSTATEAVAKKAYEEAKEKAETEIALRITTEYRKEVEQREAELEEKVSF